MTHAPSAGRRRASHKEALSKAGIKRQLQHHIYVIEMEPRFPKQPPQL